MCVKHGELSVEVLRKLLTIMHEGDSDIHEFPFRDPGEWEKRKKVDFFMVSPQDIVAQGKCLCLQYIRFRLKRAGALNRKVIQRLRTITIESPATNTIIRDVFPILNGLGEELERMHPRVYSNVGRQLSRAWSDLPDAETLSLLLAEVAKELFRGGTSWARVISFVAVMGGVALDCVRLGRSEALPRLVEVFGHVVEEDLMGWLEARGGWKGLLTIRAAGADYTVMGWLSIGVAVVSSVYLATCILDSLRRLIL